MYYVRYLEKRKVTFIDEIMQYFTRMQNSKFKIIQNIIWYSIHFNFMIIGKPSQFVEAFYPYLGKVLAIWGGQIGNFHLFR